MNNGTCAFIAVPGPAEKVDIHINEASFPIIETLLDDYPTICRLTPVSRKTDSYLINHPDYIKRVLIDNHKNYVKGAGIERVKMLLGNGIIVSDGDFWKQQRRMVQPAFHRTLLQQLTEMMQTVSQQLLHTWEAKARDNIAINVSEDTSNFALEVMLRGIFSDDLDRIIDETGSNPFAIFTEDTSRDVNLVIKFRALMKVMQAIIERRRRSPSSTTDMLAAMMQARNLQGEPMTDKALIDEMMTLIVAGHETSAITLTWMWYLLAQHPDIENRLHTEVDALNTPLASPNFEQLAELPYCKQVMFETLRLYPPVWLFPRRALQDDRFGDYFIPAGSDVFITPYFLHRNAELWPEPEQFQPNRFTDAASKKHHQAAFIPFSAGPRRCIGDVFATVEMQIHMATIARKLRLRADKQQKIELEPGINLRNKHPIMMTAELR